ncbi:MAG: hypothetical protein MNPFHGCM_03009 [Gemmatimonadaceae bacterium]|nr:hypothetical protein [Gemmatimonadaceae bacterium]
MRSWGVGCLALLAVAGCASLESGADYDRGVSLAAFRTYAFDTPDALPTGDPRLDNNPFFDARMRAAVELEMAAKGLRHSESSPDLLVHYHASVKQRLDVIRADRERGYTDITGAETSVVNYDEGTILVDVADARTKRVIWRGWAKSDFGAAMNDARAMDSFVQKAVHAMFERFLK